MQECLAEAKARIAALEGASNTRQVQALQAAGAEAGERAAVLEVEVQRGAERESALQSRAAAVEGKLSKKCRQANELAEQLVAAQQQLQDAAQVRNIPVPVLYSNAISIRIIG